MIKILNESKVKTINSSMLDTLYNDSWYTIEGAGGDLNDWVNGYQEMFDKENIGTIQEFVTFSGKDMNEYYELSGRNRYPDNFTFLAFPLNGLNMSKLAIFKLRMGDRWFDDIVDNSLDRDIDDEDDD